MNQYGVHEPDICAFWGDNKRITGREEEEEEVNGCWVIAHTRFDHFLIDS